jgi:hypothetical protein
MNEWLGAALRGSTETSVPLGRGGERFGPSEERRRRLRRLPALPSDERESVHEPPRGETPYAGSGVALRAGSPLRVPNLKSSATKRATSPTAAG